MNSNVFNHLYLSAHVGIYLVYILHQLTNTDIGSEQPTPVAALSSIEQGKKARHRLSVWLVPRTQNRRGQAVRTMVRMRMQVVTGVCVCVSRPEVRFEESCAAKVASTTSSLRWVDMHDGLRSARPQDFMF